MKTSYQVLAVQVAVIEDKLDFILKTFSVTKQYEHPLVPGQVIREVKTLLDVYRELKGLGAVIVPVDPQPADAPAEEV